MELQLILIQYNFVSIHWWVVVMPQATEPAAELVMAQVATPFNQTDSVVTCRQIGTSFGKLMS